ncbi:MAG TPA: glycosyltransferase family A protein [Gaiellaceae bacterium]|nr:glycosyltransferase family A protein [Gaiellaceae bacterium]
MRTRRVVAVVTPASVKKVRRAILALAPIATLARTTRLRAGFDGEEAPLVSVVIPTYNWSSVLRFAVASALAQTYPRLEVVVVGDGCTDDSEKVVASFDDERVRWHNLPENSGSQSTPNNAGIELARGEWIAYLGHDDVWLPSHLSLLMAAVLDAKADIGYAVTELIGPPGSGYRSLSGIRGEELGPRPSALVHRTTLVDEIGPWHDYRTINRPPDEEFVDRAHEHGMRFATSRALTVIKFPSVWRRNSYRTKLCEEQAHHSRRIQSERGFVARELAALAFARVVAQFRPTRAVLPQWPETPNPVPLGWGVTEGRRIRGLEDR